MTWWIALAIVWPLLMILVLLFMAGAAALSDDAPRQTTDHGDWVPEQERV